MGLIKNLRLARETLRIVRTGGYCVAGERVALPAVDFAAVEVVSPDLECRALGEREAPMCRFEVVNADSFQAAADLPRPVVMNFANAHVAGGGFWLGATAQEEALCRNSTLYASIASKTAARMYWTNNFRPRRVESDCLLYSPNVVVFRDAGGNLLTRPYPVAVVSAPAPNRRGFAVFASTRRIREAMKRRMRMIFQVAHDHGHRHLVLGAWGCGAFGNPPAEVAEDFRRVLVDEGFGRAFELIRFAIYGTPRSRNLKTFTTVFV